MTGTTYLQWSVQRRGKKQTKKTQHARWCKLKVLCPANATLINKHEPFEGQVEGFIRDKGSTDFQSKPHLVKPLGSYLYATQLSVKVIIVSDVIIKYLFFKKRQNHLDALDKTLYQNKETTWMLTLQGILNRSYYFYFYWLHFVLKKKKTRKKVKRYTNPQESLLYGTIQEYVYTSSQLAPC